MKKIFLIVGLGAFLTAGLSSCMTMKRDCQGVKHTRLKNGIYI